MSATTKMRRRSSVMRELTDEAINGLDQCLKLPAMSDPTIVSNDARLTFLLM